MAMNAHGMSTSFPFSTPQWKYDVFMSFRGEDTRKGFTDHLYSALEQQGIIAFRDDPELKKGKAIYPELLTAIKESRFALIVLSQNYASSTWCLEELSKILECMEARKTAMPIFYNVNPSHVRKQTGSFAEAFAKHQERFNNDTEKVQRWRSALKQVANISGWHSKDWYESKLIKDIVEVIWTKLQPTSSLENLVGIDSRLKPINLHLGAGEDDVRFIGIWGMGGIGKTTTARVVYERISSEFECSLLVTDVRNMVEKSGLVNLQKKLLSGIWRNKDDISDFHQGATIISRSLLHKKVLLILDDVNHLDHLKYLAGNKTWFGPGSRVIITTRNEHLLVRHGVERRLKVEGLNYNDALKLFSWNAFKKDYPEQNYLDLSNEVMSYAQGLPLALEVLGSFLHGRGLSEWNCALRKLGKVCNSKIFDILKISYDGLDGEDKKIFLDIACFFNGEDKDRVIKILTACDLSAIIGINVLIERSLLTVLDDRLWMHDSLQEMGREIVIRESPNELGRRSRLWLCEDTNYVLSKNTGTEVVEGIVLRQTDGPGLNVDARAFSMMNQLRYLEINNVILSNGLEYLPNSLRILKWVGYPLKSFPSHFNPEKLLELNLCNSCIKNFQMGIKPLYNLKAINLSHSLTLVNTPNFKSMPNLELLILEGCIQLHEVDQSIGVLERLTLLNLKDCKNLVGLPNSVCGLKSLKALNLSGCSKFEKLPIELGHVECLEELDMGGTAISEVPSSIGLLKNLKALCLQECKGQSPKWWNMIFNPFLLFLKRSLVPTPLSLPWLSGLNSLTTLNLRDCNLLEGAILDDLSCLSSLRSLDLSRNQFVSLPSMCQLSRLEYLNLEYCPRLQALPGLPSCLYVDVSNCISLYTLFDPSRQWNSAISAKCVNCFKLVEKQGIESMALLSLMQYLQDYKPKPEFNRFIFVGPGNEIPEWFNHQSVGSSVSLELHPGWLSDKWMGFAICAVFEIHEIHQPSLDDYFVCKLKVNGEDWFPWPGLVYDVVTAHLWLVYMPYRFHEREWQDMYYQLEFSFVFSKGVVGEVNKCGVRMVYKAELEAKSNVSISEALEFPDANVFLECVSEQGTSFDHKNKKRRFT